MVLVSDLYEGGSVNNLLHVCKGIIEGGSKLIALTALGMDANPNYNRRIAATLAEMGAFVGAMTPEHLAEHVGKMLN